MCSAHGHADGMPALVSPHSGADIMRGAHITAWITPIVTLTTFDQQAHSKAASHALHAHRRMKIRVFSEEAIAYALEEREDDGSAN